MSSVTFGELRSAAFCARQCYYDRTTDGGTPPKRHATIKALAHRYASLLDADRRQLTEEPIAIDPAAYRERLARARALHPRWEELCEPAARDVLVAGRDCRGIVDKVLEDPLEPVMIATGKPPDRGVWEAHSIKAVAAAKALAWEYGERVERATLEYPAYGVVRRIDLTTRRKAAYRRTLRTVREMDGPPARTDDRSKCDHCEYATQCGVKTRTLRSLLGGG
ncbi:CRISPR-associated protein Cas4 [Halovivax gelatinilyticus]|uniref:CRISPR-associated protein Cas4 n=1 Tax=Halovivax gelatinilyticus TaxID=2961597 RepID=UPI0020CA6386|nr:hypothetical protein [Halovivax gelatinilyticus]